MIVKIQKAGSSFKGLTTYLTDEKERVAWTHSLNCANDDVASVVHELYMTYSQAEFLKEQAGVHAGGSTVDKPVKHISLNWHPDEAPTREDMIAATEAFLKRMGWDEHQALLVAHNDKAHAHVHIELNRIHPETGKALNDNFERRRASDWALDYERERGNIYCADRLLEHENRTPSPTRDTWRQLREAEDKYHSDERASVERMEADHFQRGDREEEIKSREWHLLKGHQRAEREAFFAEGKAAFKEVRTEVYREVREKFREDWGAYYAATRTVTDREARDHWKSALIDLQQEAFDKAKEEAFGMLREVRKEEYQELLEEQREEKRALARAQGEGHRSYDLLNYVNHEPEATAWVKAVEPANQNEPVFETDEVHKREPAEEGERAAATRTPDRDGIGGLADLGGGFIGGVATLVERLFDGFLDPRPAKKEAPRAEPDPNEKQLREAARLQRIEAAIEAAREERERQRSAAYWQDRQRRRD